MLSQMVNRSQLAESPVLQMKVFLVRDWLPFHTVMTALKFGQQRHTVDSVASLEKHPRHGLALLLPLRSFWSCFGSPHEVSFSHFKLTVGSFAVLCKEYGR